MTKEKIKIILASNSPRRKELMENMGLTFEVIPSTFEEDNNQKMKLSKLSESLSEQKALDVFNRTKGPRVVIGSDTLVSLNGKVFGKPKNKDDARRMLKTLSKSWHTVITSLAVFIEKNGEVKKYVLNDQTKVKFIKLTDEIIEEYLTHDEYKDKAGAYAMQGLFGMFIKKIKGSYATVIGLPTHRLFEVLHKENIM